MGQEDIIQMRQELIRRRLQQTSQDGESRELNVSSSSPTQSHSQLQQTSQDGESRELNTDKSGSEAKLAAPTKMELVALAEKTFINIEKLEELQKDGILDKMPRDRNGELPSAGSLKHEEKAC